MQAGCIAVSIICFGQATLINILYASRGLWTVVLVWVVGHWFGNQERGHGHRVMARRMIGAGLLLVAVLLVVRRGRDLNTKQAAQDALPANVLFVTERHS